MGLPTLGYEPDSTLPRSEIARVQLIEAIRLFTANRFLAALTLAGAAEEILGKLLLRQGRIPAVKESAQAIASLGARNGLSDVQRKSEKDLVDGWNEGRNYAKHLMNPENGSVSLNLCDEAYWMIRRGLENAKALGVPIDNKDDLENWVIVNVAT